MVYTEVLSWRTLWYSNNLIHFFIEDSTNFTWTTWKRHWGRHFFHCRQWSLMCEYYVMSNYYKVLLLTRKEPRLNCRPKINLNTKIDKTLHFCHWAVWEIYSRWSKWGRPRERGEVHFSFSSQTNSWNGMIWKSGTIFRGIYFSLLWESWPMER